MKKSFVLLLALLVAAPACFAADPAPDPNPDPGLVDVLIEKLAVTDKVKKRAGEQFVKNAAKGNLKAMDEGYKQARSSTHWPDYSTKALRAAAKAGYIEAVQYLLDKGVNINSYLKPKNENSDVQYTALCAAAESNKILMMKYLLNRGASPAVVCAISEGRPLPLRPKDVILRVERRSDTLPTLDKNQLYVWKMLLRKDKSRFAYGSWDGNIQHLVYYGDMELIELLRDGGHFKLIGDTGRLTVASAFMSGNIGKVNRMKEGGGLLSLLSQDDYDKILAYSALANHIDMAAWLLKNRQFSQHALDNALNQLAFSEKTWYEYHVSGWPIGKTLSKEMITLLRSHGAHFSEYDAALQNGMPWSKLQLAGGDVKEIAAATSGRTLLELYKRKRKSEVVLLIKNGAPNDSAERCVVPTVNEGRDYEDVVPEDDTEKLLVAAIDNGDIEFLKQILPYKQIPKCHYFLEKAVAKKDLKLFNLLLQNYNEEKVDFTRLLGTAVHNQSLALTKLFVEKGGDVNGYISGYVYIRGGTKRMPVYPNKMLTVANLVVENFDIAYFLTSKGATE
ncbi:MAG: ankyrin repeat domain-containing protein [Elusimicrobia bacterium]|nr:ankyrin repeat domain-containing protein [Elusimicrobiota bacterium]MDD7501632.1 ankyrin repeat domain-containing protein [Elusimicrobiota bacterium]MDY5729184.1 ankyrin repeat domain-containing protein [Elusimicrobiaceae bacterium]